MPAVQLNLLKDQIQQLSGKFDQPVDFRLAITELLNLYSDRTYKAGDTVRQPLLTPAYRPPALVLRQIEMALTTCARQSPQAALFVSTELWQSEYLETRLLAAFLLGQIPVPPHLAVVEHLRAFCQSGPERILLEAVIDQGSYLLRQKASDPWLQTIRAWLSSGDSVLQTSGIMALKSMVADERFTNLPAIYAQLNDQIAQIPDRLSDEMQGLIIILAQRSTGETAHFLRQMITTQNSVSVVRLIRRCIPDLPASIQANVRAAFPTDVKPVE